MYITVKFYQNTGSAGGKGHPENKDSTRLLEFSLMNNTNFVAIYYDIHLDLKLDYTVSRTLQEISISKIETPLLLCEFERTPILRSLALAVLKTPYAGCFLSGNRSIFVG